MTVFERIYQSQPFTDTERMVLQAVRELVRDRIAPRAEHYDHVGEFPWDNLRDMNEIGLNGVFVPPEYGGAGLSYACYLVLVKELTKGCASTGATWATNYHCLAPILEFGTEEQRQRLVPVIARGGIGSLVMTEESGGSDATQMQTSFAPDGDDVVVNGSKVFITNGDVADLYLVFGKWQGIEEGRKAISALVIEKGAPGLQVVRREDKMGHRASSTAALSFQDCRVPRHNLLGQPGDGMKILFGALNKSRPSIAAQALGIAQAAFEDAVTYANQRTQFGKRIIEFQAIQFMVADMAAKLAMAEAWMFHVARLVDAGISDIVVEASMLKLAASDLAMEIATNAVQLYGGYGYIRGQRVERLFRDAKLTQIWEGTNQIQRIHVGGAFIQRH